MMILVFLLFVVGAMFLFRWMGHGERRYERYTNSDDALSVLKKRYANGEITRDEYERMKKDLGF